MTPSVSAPVLAREVCVSDWGTTGFRLWRLSPAGEVLGVKRGAFGMSRLRGDDYPRVLEEALGEVGAGSDAPVVVCGMAGAAQGWVEAPYLQLPFAVGELAAAAVAVSGVERKVFILPGVAQRKPEAPDVMRGEETILCGVLAEGGLEGWVCLPGTHSKWVEASGGRVLSFATALTGEMFALLARHSTLAPYVSDDMDGVSDSEAFAAGVREAWECPRELLRFLFGVRARSLLFDAADGSARLLGLLIGAELVGQGLQAGEKVTLLSSGALASAYGKALEMVGVEARRLDAEHFAVRGLYLAARHILGEPEKSL